MLAGKRQTSGAHQLNETSRVFVTLIRQDVSPSKAAFMFKEFIPCLVLLVCFAGAAHAQTLPDASSNNPPSSSRNEHPVLNSPEEELKYKAVVKREQSAHRELLERADEVVKLGEEIRSAFEHNKTLTREEWKKLDRMEKLTRKIRSGAGGSDDDELLKDSPHKLDIAVARLCELSGLIDKSIKKTSRLTVSATVIERSNELIELIKRIRTFVQP
ncbi:MAG: hypothetical protein LC754_13915 [Acidobacteria bacterium]|nr:hypothetical protein [Acidobacteriota bacterium]